MRNLTLQKIAEVCGGTLHAAEGKTTREASCVVIDSRRIEAGGVFIATRGERVDGHSFIPEVFAKGALAVVCERLPEEPAGACILVEDGFDALRRIAGYYRQQLDCRIVGITGSVGKTSTKEMIASVLRQHYSVCSTEGNYNNEIGVPLTLLRIRETDACAVIEMGINHFGEMTRLSALVQPDIVVITNIGSCHLEALGDRDGVLRAKTEIFTHMKADGQVVLNGMDDKLATIREVNGKAPLRYGIAEGDASGLDVYMSQVRSRKLEGSEAILHGRSGSGYPVRIPLPGEHMVLNAAAAAAVGELLGVPEDEIAAGIAATEAVSGRSRILRGERYTIIDDCYNANPTSVRAAIDLLCASEEPKRTLAILGDMYELGSEERELHAKIGQYAAERGVHALLCIGALSKETARAARDGVAWVRDDESVEQVTERLEEFLSDALPEGGTVLVKASHGMYLERIVAWLREHTEAR